jgi:hypothetical protein
MCPKCVNGLLLVAAIAFLGWTSSRRTSCPGGSCSPELMLIDALHPPSARYHAEPVEPAFEQLEVMPREVSESAVEVRSRQQTEAR